MKFKYRVYACKLSKQEGGWNTKIQRLQYNAVGTRIWEMLVLMISKKEYLSKLATVAKCIEQWIHTHWYIAHSCWSVRYSHFVFACKNVILLETLALLQDRGEDNHKSSIN